MNYYPNLVAYSGGAIVGWAFAYTLWLLPFGLAIYFYSMYLTDKIDEERRIELMSIKNDIRQQREALERLL